MEKAFLKFIKHINTFEEFTTQLSALDNNKEKGDYFEVLCKYVFKFHPKYQDNTRTAYLFHEIPIFMLNAINIPDKDKGIDMIWENIEGELYAVQCKFRTDTEDTIPWKELSTFAGLTYLADNVKGGIFMTNQDSICKELLNSDKVEKDYGDFWDTLPKYFFKNIRRHFRGKGPKSYNPDKLRDYQQTIIQRTCDYFDGKELELLNDSQEELTNRRRGKLISACATGKMLMGKWIYKMMGCKKAILAVPSLNLLSQNYYEWISSMKNKPYFLLIGSDMDPDIKESYKGVMTTTDQEEILKKIKKYNKIVVMTTYQSAHLLCNQGLEFDLCIFDEAHRTVGQKGSEFTHLLYDENINIKNRLFMTATPRVYKGKDDTITSMDDIEIYGHTIYEYNTARASTDGWLNPYEILHLYVTVKQMESYIKKNELLRIDGEIKESNNLASAILLLKAMIEHSFNHVITYHNNVTRAKEFCKSLQELLADVDKDNVLEELVILQVDGNDSMKMRRKIFNEFKKSKLAIMCTSRILNEGVNMPIIDCVCFVDARNSVIDIVQCVGRCLRKYEGKGKSYVLIPNEIDENDLDGAYKNIWNVVRALCTTDTSLLDEVKAKTLGLVGKGGTRIMSENLIDVGDNVEIKEWINGIESRLWESADMFDVNVERVKKWREKNKRFPSQCSKDTEERFLGFWIINQRQNYKNNKLSEYKIKKIETIDEWIWKKNNSFDENFDLFIEFVKNNKKFPSACSNYKKEKVLGTWAQKQIHRYKNNKLSNYKIKKLETIEGWSWKRNNSFDENYVLLVEFVKNNKKLPSSNSKNNDEKLLYTWVCSLQKRYNAGNLPDDKIEKLEKIDHWKWKILIRKSHTIEERYEQLLDFLKKNSRFPSECAKDKDEMTLARWITRLRHRYKNDKLSTDKIKKLENIDGWRWAIGDKFKKKYKLVKKFVENNNKFPSVTSDDNIETKLGAWINHQRYLYKLNKLSAYQIKKLENLTGWYWNRTQLNEIKFVEKCDELIKFVNINKKIPSKRSPDLNEKRLGIWVFVQKRRFKKHKISNAQIQKLESIEGWKWSI